MQMQHRAAELLEGMYTLWPWLEVEERLEIGPGGGAIKGSGKRKGSGKGKGKNNSKDKATGFELRPKHEI